MGAGIKGYNLVRKEYRKQENHNCRQGPIDSQWTRLPQKKGICFILEVSGFQMQTGPNQK